MRSINTWYFWNNSSKGVWFLLRYWKVSCWQDLAKDDVSWWPRWVKVKRATQHLLRTLLKNCEHTSCALTLDLRLSESAVGNRFSDLWAVSLLRRRRLKWSKWLESSLTDYVIALWKQYWVNLWALLLRPRSEDESASAVENTDRILERGQMEFRRSQSVILGFYRNALFESMKSCSIHT